MDPGGVERERRSLFVRMCLFCFDLPTTVKALGYFIGVYEAVRRLEKPKRLDVAARVTRGIELSDKVPSTCTEGASFTPVV